MDDREKDSPLLDEKPSDSVKLELVGTAEQQAALFDALAKASGEFTQIVNEATGQIGHRNFTYADLDVLVKATRPALAKNGIIVLQPMNGPDHLGNHRISTIVAGHGAQLRAHTDYRRSGDLKEWGKQTTYIRRYGYRGMFVLDGSDDADNGQPEEPARQQARPTPPAGPPKDAKPKQPPRAETKPAEAPKQSTPPPPPKAQTAPAPQSDAPPETPAAQAPQAATAPPTTENGAGAAETRPPSQPPPLPASQGTPDEAQVDAECKRLLQERRPVIPGVDGRPKTYAKFDKELVLAWTQHVCGKPRDQVTLDDKINVILPALRALPMRQEFLPGTAP